MQIRIVHFAFSTGSRISSAFKSDADFKPRDDNDKFN